MNKKVLIIIAHEGFRDKELSWLTERFDVADIGYDIGSSHLSEAKGRFGDIVVPDVLIRLVNSADYDGFILVGEEAAQEFVGNEDVIKIVEHAADRSKLVAAIGEAVMVLTRSRILNGRKVTGPSHLKPTFEEAGAFFHGKLVEIDNNLITASGPYGTREFAEAIVEYLAEGETHTGRKYLR